MRRALALTAVAIALGGTLAACGTDTDPVRPQTVKLTARNLGTTVRIGMVVSLKAAPGQGSEWTSAASGAEVASYRYQLGGTRVELDVVDDQGTAEGASAALDQLVSDKVSGIVMATSGSHLDGVLAGATPASTTPILMPYSSGGTDLPDNVWLTGPSTDQVAQATKTLLTDQQWDSAVLIRSDADQPDPVGAVADVTVPSGGSTATVVTAVKAAVKKGADVALVEAPVETATKVVAALQSAKIDLPVVIGGRDAVSPSFAGDLSDAGGSLAGQLFTIGTDSGDVTALGTGTDARRVSTYFAALRSAADSSMKGLFDQGTFRSEAGTADIASHDAVVALVAAANSTGSSAPDKVREALTKATLGTSDGIAGPTLDFRKQSAVPDDDVHALAATTQDPGVRPTASDDDPDQLFWFVVPSSGTV